MRYSSLLALCAFMLCLNTPEVRGEILAVHTYDVMTHTALLPKPVASDNTFSLAATWWLPDWQGSQGSRGSADDGGGDIVKDDSDCMEHYNLYAICPSPKLSTGVVHPVAGMTCQKSCYCPSEYQYTSSNCSGKYTVSGGSCDGKYNACVCKSEYSQNSSNCNGEYRPAGESCDGNYNRCEMRPECTVSSMSCTYGCAGYNSCDRCTSCKSNPDCDVSDKSCTYGCASYNSCSKCTSCKSCTPSANDTGCTYGTESCSDGCGGTRLCCKGHTHSYSCPSGYQSSSCSSSQVQTGTTSKVCSCGAASGTCYSCRAKTCSDDPCMNGCYTNIGCTYGCKTTNSCGGCEVCYTYEEDTCIGLTGSPDCEQINGYLCTGTVMTCGGKKCCCPTGQCYDNRGYNMCDCALDGGMM